MARALPGLVGRDLAVEAQDRGGDQRLLQAIADVVQQVAGGEVVAAVGHDVVAGDEPLGIGRGQPLVVRLDAHLGIDVGQRAPGALDLGRADVGGAMDDLALQVGEIDRVVVDHAQGADAGGREILQQGRAKPAGAQHQHLRGDQPRLAHAADLGQHDMARVPPDLHFGHVGQPSWSAYSMGLRTDAATTTPDDHRPRPARP